ncbi:MAG: carbohydrate kinase family protein [Rectinemataceae bacterium]
MNPPNSPHPELLCLGHAMVDLYLRSSREVWQHLRELLSDLLPFDGAGAEKGFRTPLHLQQAQMEAILRTLGQEVRDRHVQAVAYAGGSALNAARMAARSGVHAAFAGTIGNDGAGLLLQQTLANSGVKAQLSIPHGAHSRTGVFLILEDTAGIPEAILVAPMAAREILTLDPAALPWPQGGIVHLEGLLADAPDFWQGVLADSRRHCCSVSIDIGAAGIARRHASTLRAAIAQHASFLFATREELAALDEDGWLDRLRQREACCIIKDGAQGVTCLAGSRSFSLPAPDVAVVSTVGAGDAFAGAFLAAHLQGSDIPTCLDAGTRAAALVLREEGNHPGDRPSLPDASFFS